MQERESEGNVTYHHVLGYIEIGYSSCQIQHRTLLERSQTLAGGTQQPHIVDDTGEVHIEYHLCLSRNLILGQHRSKHIHRVGLDGYRRAEAVVRYVQHVEELLARKVAREGLQRFVAMHKDDGIIMIQKVFRTCRASSACTKVVHKSHRVVLQWHSGAARLSKRERERGER